MKALIKLALFVGLLYAGYYEFLRTGCGTRGAAPCPDPALENGEGVTLDASEVCHLAGYLCAEHSRPFQIVRASLQKGFIRVRVTTPKFFSDEINEQLRNAAIEGILMWQGHGIPIEIIQVEYPWTEWDAEVFWNGLGGADRLGEAQLPTPSVTESHQLADFASARIIRLGVPNLEPRLMAILIKQVATHEMGHTLGLLHSDSENDIMFKATPENWASRRTWVTPRDLLSLDTLYSLPNGATIK